MVPLLPATWGHSTTSLTLRRLRLSGLPSLDECIRGVCEYTCHSLRINHHGRGCCSLLVDTQEELESALHQVRVLRGHWGSPGKVPVAMIPHDFSIECKISCNKEESQQTHHGFCDKRMKAKCQLRVWKLAWGKLPLGKC